MSDLPSDPSTPFRWPNLFQNNRVRLIGSLISLAVVVVLIGIAFQRLSVAELWLAIRQAQWPWLVVAVLILVAGQGLRILRMVRLLHWEAAQGTATAAQSPTTAAQAVIQGTMMAQVINWISPIRAGDIYRVLHIHQNGRNSWLWVASSVLIEKSADSLVLAVFALVLAVSPMPNQNVSVAIRLFATAFAGVLAVSAVLALQRGRWQAAVFKRFPQLQQFAETQMGPASATFYAARPSHWLETAFISLGIWLLAMSTNWALGQAFGLHINWVTLLSLVIGLQTGAILSPIPGNIGVIPVITLAVLATTGVDPTIALAMGSAHYILVYGVNLALCGLSYLWPWLSHKAQARGRLSHL